MVVVLEDDSPTVVIAAAIMVKNEENRIKVTLDSVQDFADCLVILDTGSSDSTLSIIRQWCSQKKIKAHLMHSEFDNFSTSRNKLLNFADDKADVLLLLDSNDELRNGKRCREHIQKQYPMWSRTSAESKNAVDEFDSNGVKIPRSSTTIVATSEKILDVEEIHGVYMTQIWYNINNQVDKYFNIRMIRTKQKWYYSSPVHEYIHRDHKDATDHTRTVRFGDDFAIVQHRQFDQPKSVSRFSLDRDMLIEELEKNPDDSRSVFYLAQTYCSLMEYKSSFHMYRKRVGMQGFAEEVYQSYLKLADLAILMKHPSYEVVHWLQASLEYRVRAETLLRLSSFYLDQVSPPRHLLAFMYTQMACQLLYPENEMLFVDQYAYCVRRFVTRARLAKFVVSDKEAALTGLQQALRDPKVIAIPTWIAEIQSEIDILNN